MFVFHPRWMSLCAPQKPACIVFVAPQTARKIDEQRRRLGDACVLAVPAEYAGPSSGSGDHPQQYDVHPVCTGLYKAHSPHLTPWPDDSCGEKHFHFFLAPNSFYLDSFISPDRPSQRRTSTLFRGGGPASLRCNALFGVGLRWSRLRSCIRWSPLPKPILMYVFKYFFLKVRTIAAI